MPPVSDPSALVLAPTVAGGVKAVIVLADRLTVPIVLLPAGNEGRAVTVTEPIAFDPAGIEGIDVTDTDPIALDPVGIAGKEDTPTVVGGVNAVIVPADNDTVVGGVNAVIVLADRLTVPMVLVPVGRDGNAVTVTLPIAFVPVGKEGSDDTDIVLGGVRAVICSAGKTTGRLAAANCCPRLNDTPLMKSNECPLMNGLVCVPAPDVQ